MNYVWLDPLGVRRQPTEKGAATIPTKEETLSAKGQKTSDPTAKPRPD